MENNIYIIDKNKIIRMEDHTSGASGIYLVIFSAFTHLSGFFLPANIGTTANYISAVGGILGIILILSKLYKMIFKKDNK